MNLYKITNERLLILENIDETGELTPEIETALTINSAELESVATDLVNYGKMIEGNNDLIDKEIKRLKLIKERNDKKAETIKAVLLQALLTFGEEDSKGIKRLDLGLVKLSTRKSEETIIHNTDDIPHKYLRAKIELNLELWEWFCKQTTLPIETIEEQLDKFEIDAPKTPIKEAIKAGETIKGAEVLPKVNLVIK